MIYVNKYAYLYGGRSYQIMKDFTRLDPRTGNWIRLDETDGVPDFGRFGHTCLQFKRYKLVIFGGEKQFNVQRKTRDCLNDVRVFDTKNKTWDSWKTTSTSFPIEFRRNHSACICGKHMFVYGGIDSSGKYLNDFWELNMKTRQWTYLYVEKSGYKGIAFHAMCPVFDHHRRPHHIILHRPLPKLYRDELPFEGLFVFGG